MPNLVVEVAPPERTSEINGMSHVVRTLGTAIGTQLATGCWRARPSATRARVGDTPSLLLSKATSSHHGLRCGLHCGRLGPAPAACRRRERDPTLAATPVTHDTDTPPAARDDVDPDTAYDQPASDIAALHCVAVQELFDERRTQIPLLARRGEEAESPASRRLPTSCPLLFATPSTSPTRHRFVEQAAGTACCSGGTTLSVETLPTSTSPA